MSEIYVQDLKPCPFCGGTPSLDAYDRLISIGCKPCGYTRAFPGLLQTTPNDKPILEYRKGDGSIQRLSPDEAKEFYHRDAAARAKEAWNRRSIAQPGGAA